MKPEPEKDVWDLFFERYGTPKKPKKKLPLCRYILYFLLAVLSITIAIEFYLIFHHLPTISERVWAIYQEYPPTGFLAGGSVVLLLAILIDRCTGLKWVSWASFASFVAGVVAGHFFWVKDKKEGDK